MKIINVVAAIIIKDGQVFASKRGYGEFKGWWEFPGGKVEPGETNEEALIREIKEETQLELPIDTSFNVYTEYDLPNGNRKQMTLYTAELDNHEDIHLQVAEIKNYGWFSYQDARQQLTYDNLRMLLDQVNDHLTK